MGVTSFHVSSQHSGDRRVRLRLAGELDGSSADALATVVDGVPDGAHVIVDCSSLTFVDSAGLRALASAQRAVQRAGGVLAVHAPSPRLLRLLELTDLADMLVWGGASRADAG
jgi:stage II sporulation protein AA (anti-sigma F factor antagonist)